MRPLILFTLILAAATLACGLAPALVSATPEPSPVAPQQPSPGWLQYVDPAGFSIRYPPTWQRRDAEGYPVVFSVAAAPGTNLIEKRTEIDVRNASGECRQSTYQAGTGGESLTAINGREFLVEQGSGIAAGNIYDWNSYSRTHGGTCITIAFVLHSSGSGVHATEPAPFDAVAESAIFTQIIQTFYFEN